MKHLMKKDSEKTVQTVDLQVFCEPEKGAGPMMRENRGKRLPETEKNGLDREGKNRKRLHGHGKELHGQEKSCNTYDGIGSEKRANREK